MSTRPDVWQDGGKTYLRVYSDTTADLVVDAVCLAIATAGLGCEPWFVYDDAQSVECLVYRIVPRHDLGRKTGR